MNKQRDSFIEFFSYNFNFIRKTILPMIGLGVTMENPWSGSEFSMQNILWVFALVMVVFSFFKWRNRIFEIEQDMIRISEGVLRKDQNDVPFNRIKSINTSDTLFKRMFGISTLNVELVGGKQISFTLANEKIEVLRKGLFNEVAEKQKEKRIEKLSIGQYMLLATTNAAVFLGALSLIAAVFPLLFGGDNGSEAEVLQQVGESVTQPIGMVQHALIISAAIGILSIAVYLITVVTTYLTFANFSVTSNEKELAVTYGWLSKKKYLIPKEQIRTLRIVEPLLLRKFGYVQLKLDNIGLNDGGNTSIILYPIMKKQEISALLKEHIPLFEQREAETKPELSALPIYLFRSVWLIVVIVAVLVYFFPSFWWLFVLVSLFTWVGYNRWNQAGLSFDKEYVTLSKAKFLGKETLITLKQYVEATGTEQSMWMKRKKQQNYFYAVYSERQTELYDCEYLTETKKKDFLSYLQN